jgi:hypothetical protein
VASTADKRKTPESSSMVDDVADTKRARGGAPSAAAAAGTSGDQGMEPSPSNSGGVGGAANGGTNAAAWRAHKQGGPPPEGCLQNDGLSLSLDHFKSGVSHLQVSTAPTPSRSSTHSTKQLMAPAPCGASGRCHGF